MFLNQGGALLHVYNDGSVLLTHGGMEMGQGLHTKMVQVVFFHMQESLKKCVLLCDNSLQHFVKLILYAKMSLQWAYCSLYMYMYLLCI